MVQYCRYCDHMQCGGRRSLGYCEVRNKLYTPEHLAHTNDCEHFSFNPIDALRQNRTGYRPRNQDGQDGASVEGQTTIFDVLGE